mmetsp:Transcript_18901/g.25200  ORF Transcript_18901/g.25200 Transcript_18901/m.25200 type:complete len:341 (+) Transcript_18901:734-1756(+)
MESLIFQGSAESNASKIQLVMPLPKGNNNSMSDFDVHYPATNRTERRSSLDLQPNNGMNSKGAFDSEEGYKCEQAQRFSAALSPMAKFLVRMSSFSGKLPGSKERDMDDLLMKDGEDLSFVSNYMYSTPQVLLDPPRNPSKGHLEQPPEKTLCGISGYSHEIQCVKAVDGCSGFSFVFDTAIDFLPRQQPEKPTIAVAIGGRSCSQKSTWLQSTFQRLRKPRKEELTTVRGCVFKPPNLPTKETNPDDPSLALLHAEVSGVKLNKGLKPFPPILESSSRAYPQTKLTTIGSEASASHAARRRKRSKYRKNERQILLSNESLLSNSESECDGSVSEEDGIE